MLRCALVGLLFVVCLQSGSAADPSLDEQFVHGLRERRLFQLAEAFCARQLDRSDLDDADRLGLTLELARTLVAHAQQSLPEARPALWNSAQQTLSDWLAVEPRHPRRLLVQVQGALVPLEEGELLRLEAEALGGDEEALAAAREPLRQAIRALDDAATATNEALREANLRPNTQENSLSPRELSSLAIALQFQHARALRNQALTYPPASADFDNALRQAAELLEPLAGLDPVDPLVWPARVELAACLRLLADYEAVERLLRAWQMESPPVETALRLQAETIRLLLESGALEQAVQLCERATRGPTSAELDFAILETVLAQAEAALEGPARAQPQQRAAAIARELDHRYGPYWGRRAGLLVARRAASATSDLDVLVQSAEEFFRAGQIEEALDAYDRAATSAQTAGDTERAFDIGWTAAALVQTLGDFAAAGQRWLTLAETPGEPRAADAHLLAIYSLAEKLRVQAQPDYAEYAGLLNDHLARWPEHASTATARLWLGRLQMTQGDWAAAVSTLEGIPPTALELPEAWPLLVNCRAAQRAAAVNAGIPIDRLVADELAWYEQLAATTVAPVEIRQLALLEPAALALSVQHDYSTAERLLQELLQSPGADEANWRPRAVALLAVALAAQQQLEEAAQVLEQLPAEQSATWAEIAAQLGALREGSAETARPALAQLTLTALQRAGPAVEPDIAKQRLLWRVWALHDAGQTATALEELQAAAAESPQDGDLQESLGQFLLASGGKSELEAAVRKFRELESRSRPGTPRWFRAKYYLASAYERLGDKAMAAQVIRATRALYPELGGPPWSTRMAELLQRCE